MNRAPLSQRLLAEWLGTALLVATVIGSGIMAERLAGGSQALALLGNTIPTGAILVGLTITAAYWFTSSTSFANPAVTLARGFTTTFAGIAIGDVAGFVLAQLIGAAAAAGLAPLLFRAPR